MQSAEDRIKYQIGDLVVQNTVLQQRLEELAGKHAELQAQVGVPAKKKAGKGKAAPEA